MSELFRRQVVEKGRARLYGEVRLDTQPSSWVVTGLLLMVFGVVAALLIVGSYARKETVTGWLVSSRGLAEIAPPVHGTVETVHLALGDRVERGEPIITLRIDSDLVGGSGAIDTILAALEEEREEVEEAAKLTAERLQAERAAFEIQRDQLEIERNHVRTQLGHQTARVELLEQTLARYEGLLEEDAASPMEIASHQERLLAGQQSSAELEQRIVQLTTEVEAVKADLTRLPIEAAEVAVEARRQLAALEQRQAEYRGQGRIVLNAPVSGTVSTLPARPGQTAIAGQPLASILPSGGILEAELFIPTRAAGFVEVGQTAKLRLDAFPNQRFGAVGGTLASLSTTVSQADTLPVSIPEDSPVYRGTVALNRQYIDAYGQRFPLQPGMTLQVDLIQEERHLWQVMLDPLLARG